MGSQEVCFKPGCESLALLNDFVCLFVCVFSSLILVLYFSTQRMSINRCGMDKITPPKAVQTPGVIQRCCCEAISLLNVFQLKLTEYGQKIDYKLDLCPPKKSCLKFPMHRTVFTLITAIFSAEKTDMKYNLKDKNYYCSGYKKERISELN